MCKCLTSCKDAKCQAWQGLLSSDTKVPAHSYLAGPEFLTERLMCSTVLSDPAALRAGSWAHCHCQVQKKGGRGGASHQQADCFVQPQAALQRFWHRKSSTICACSENGHWSHFFREGGKKCDGKCFALYSWSHLYTESPSNTSASKVLLGSS